MMALLMVISSVAIIPASVQGGCPPLVVTKTMWDGENWVSELYDVVKGDIVQFNITVTFYNYHPCQNNYVYDIVVEDYLPDGLTYESTVEPREPDEIVDNKLIWNFTEEEIKLFDGESFSIVFSTVAVEYGEQVNDVDVTAIDFCSGEPLSAEACATVHVDPRLDVEKKVWDPDEQEWVEHLDSVIKAVDVQFKITVTYHGKVTMKCMQVKDLLPEECLEYADNVYIEINGDEIEETDSRYPETTVTEHSGYWGDKTKILWDWRNVSFELRDGENVLITFDANVTDYCECTVTNKAIAHLWGCYGCQEDNHVWGCDTATVTCQPHEPVFEKTVAYNEGGKIFWGDQTTARIGDLVTFGLELTYYGNYNLTDIVITDYLPKNILVYAGDASLVVYSYYETSACKYEPFEGVVSENGTVVEFTIPVALNDSDSLKITFNAEVIGLTGDCPECGKNIAEFIGKEAGETTFTGSDSATVKTFEKSPVSLWLNVKRLHIGKISAIIQNNGGQDLTDVEWTLTVTGGLLKRINLHEEGTIDIPSGMVFSISTPARSIVRKFGRVNVNITAKVDGETFEKTMKGFAFGRIILIRPLIRR